MSSFEESAVTRALMETLEPRSRSTRRPPPAGAHATESVAELHQQVQEVVARMGHELEELARDLRDMQKRLQDTEAELGQTRDERDRMAHIAKVYGEKLASIRDLTRMAEEEARR